MITGFGSNEEALVSGYQQAPTCEGKKSVSKAGDENVKKEIRTVRNVVKS
jgi:hypothetical protein